MRRCLILCLLTASGCLPARYVRNDTPQYELNVWLDNHALLKADDALRGCAEWLPKGVVCRLTDDPAKAAVRVYASDRPCRPDKDGLRTLALAHPRGRIEFMAACFNDDGTYDQHMFRAVMTHEIGHEAGIWKHVPAVCGKDALRHPDGQSVCGEAVMNALYRSSVDYVTVIDGLAFDLRDKDWTALRKLRLETDSAATDGPSCVYRAK